MNDRRQTIIQAGLETLGQDGYAGFTQTRVAARAGLRQSHLTYYFPTRTDLLAAVGQAAIDAQLAAAEHVLAHTQPSEMAVAIANVVVRHQNTRVLMALAQAADQEPRLRGLFHQLVDGVAQLAEAFLCTVGATTTEADARMLHALAVGLAVIDLATGRPDGEARAAEALRAALTAIEQRPPP
jgi:AcrR family transcriptional regulator